MRLLTMVISLYYSNIIVAQQSLTYHSGRDIINAMHEKYSGKWYSHFTFSQNMEFFRNDTIIKKDVWHEAASLPGNLLIKFETKDSGNGMIFSNHKVTSFRNGKASDPAPMIHDLLLVGLDVYFLNPEYTCKLLDSLGYDLNIIRKDTFAGREVYVVGAQKDDHKSRQFWIDAERFYMHKIIYKQGTKINEVIFTDYYPVKKAWFSPTIIFISNGKLNLIERYYDVKFPRKMDESLFDPAKFNSVVLH
jgi:hypothetical protein